MRTLRRWLALLALGLPLGAGPASAASETPPAPAAVTTTDAPPAPAVGEALPEPVPAAPAAEAPAAADPAAESSDAALPGGAHAWSLSVSTEEQRAADVLFQQGNALMRDSLCVAAAARYREALRHWDHPNIHYNLAIALMALDQPIETYEHLKSAVRYGAAPLQQERYEHALNYLKLLEKQVADVVIRCDVEGATVELDGKMLFIGPGQYSGQVLSGGHTVVASKEGLVTNHSTRVFAGGQTTTVDLDLKQMSDLTELHRRFPKALPWAVIGAGVVIAGAGGGMNYLAVKKNEEIDTESRTLCPAGCLSGEPPTLGSKRKQAERLQRFAVGAYAVGGTAILVGGVLAYLNRTEVRVKSYGRDAPAAEVPRTSFDVRPVLEPSRVGMSLSLAF